MKNLNFGPRNTVRGNGGRAPISSPVDNADQAAAAREFSPGGQPCAAVAENPTVQTKRARGGSVDGAVGVGPADMPVEYISRSLGRLLRKGVRTATVREIDGVPYVVTKEIPEGVFVLRTADRITAYRAGRETPLAGLSVIASVSVQDPGFSVAAT